MATENKQAEMEYKTKGQRPVDIMPHEKYADPSRWAENAEGNIERIKKEQPPLDNSMKFSIIFPSRDRTNLLSNLLNSILKNTYNLKEVEVLIAIDNDDRGTFEFLTHFTYPFVKIWTVNRSLNFSKDYYTFLAKQSTGRWIITANDDCVMETPDWDIKAYEVLKDRPGVIYGWIQDHLGGFRAHGHGNYCCFPLQGRGGFEALGYIFPPRVPTWGADIWAKNLYDQINSVCEVPITLRHYCHHNKTREQDHISKRIALNQVPFDMRPTYEEINKLITALKKETVKV